MRWLWFVNLLCLVLSPLHAGEPPSAPLRRIAFGSCANQSKPQPIWDAVNALRPELFIMLGDNIYADTIDMEAMKAKYAQQAAVPSFRRLRETARILATWDDHDFGRDDAGTDYPRKKESQQLFLDFLGVPADSSRRRQEGVYSAETFGPPGQRVQIILLDTRYFRSPLKRDPNSTKHGFYLPDISSEATFLGETQWNWLEEQLRQPAEIRLIGSSIQLVAEDHPYEKWANLPRERERFLKLLEKTSAKGVIILSGDRHLAEISMLPKALPYPLYDITSSGLTEGSKHWRPLEENHRRVGTMNVGNNFGFITIDWYQFDPILRLQIRDEEGEIALQQKLRLSVIHPNHQAIASTRGTAEAPATTPNPPSTASIPTPPRQATQGGKTLSTEEASKKVGETVTVEMEVKRTGATRDGNLIFLNSLNDIRDKTNFTIVLDKAYQDRAAEIKNPRDYFKGKTVRVTGKVDTFREAAQIRVTDPKQIKVVGR